MTILEFIRLLENRYEKKYNNIVFNDIENYLKKLTSKYTEYYLNILYDKIILTKSISFKSLPDVADFEEHKEELILIAESALKKILKIDYDNRTQQQKHEDRKRAAFFMRSLKENLGKKNVEN